MEAMRTAAGQGEGTRLRTAWPCLPPPFHHFSNLDLRSPPTNSVPPGLASTTTHMLPPAASRSIIHTTVDTQETVPQSANSSDSRKQRTASLLPPPNEGRTFPHSTHPSRSDPLHFEPAEGAIKDEEDRVKVRARARSPLSTPSQSSSDGRKMGIMEMARRERQRYWVNLRMKNHLSCFNGVSERYIHPGLEILSDIPPRPVPPPSWTRPSANAKMSSSELRRAENRKRENKAEEEERNGQEVKIPRLVCVTNPRNIQTIIQGGNTEENEDTDSTREINLDPEVKKRRGEEEELVARRILARSRRDRRLLNLPSNDEESASTSADSMEINEDAEEVTGDIPSADEGREKSPSADSKESEEVREDGNAVPISADKDKELITTTSPSNIFAPLLLKPDIVVNNEATSILLSPPFSLCPSASLSPICQNKSPSPITDNDHPRVLPSSATLDKAKAVFFPSHSHDNSSSVVHLPPSHDEVLSPVNSVKEEVVLPSTDSAHSPSLPTVVQERYKRVLRKETLRVPLIEADRDENGLYVCPVCRCVKFETEDIKWTRGVQKNNVTGHMRKHSTREKRIARLMLTIEDIGETMDE